MSLKSLIGRELYRLRNRLMRNRRLLKRHNRSQGTEASKIINLICSVYPRPIRNYLEIGVEYGFTFESVNIPRKVGVDPYFRCSKFLLPAGVCLFELESNDFFKQYNDNEAVFDFVYLDGLHTYEQTWEDLCNSSQLLGKNAIIMIDDVFPSDSISAISDQTESYRRRKELGLPDDGSWHGDVYKVVATIHHFYSGEIQWFTLTDLQNPKTILLKKSSKSWAEVLSPGKTFSKNFEISYEECFSPLNIEIMRPTKTSQLIEILQNS